MKEIFDPLPLSVVLVRPDGQIVYMNSTVRDLLGVPSTTTTLNVLDLAVDAHDREVLIRQLQRRADGCSDDYEIGYRRLDNGRRLRAMVAAVGIRFKDEILSLAIVRDVTAVRAAEAILRASSCAHHLTARLNWSLAFATVEGLRKAMR